MLQILVPVALLGLAVNAEPGQVVVFTFLLGTDRPRRNAYAFLAGWMVSLAVCFAIAGSAGSLASKYLGHNDARVVAVAEVVLAIGLAWFALHEWRRRDRPRSTDDRKYLQRLQGVGPRIGFVAGIYEQPWTMTIAAGMVVVHAAGDRLDTVIAAIVFGVLSTLTLLASYLYFELRGAQAVSELRAVEHRVTSVGPRVIAWAAAIAAACFLAIGIHGLVKG